jgi:hypothetical protein
MRLSPDQNTKMLQANPNLAPVFDDPRVVCRHSINTRLDRRERCYLVGGVDDRKYRK